SENFALLTKERTRTGSQLVDLGPSLEYNFLVFNLNDLATKKLNIISGKQTWFRDLKFRQAVSAAIDRDSIVRLVYGARGTALWGNVGPGNKLWVNQAIPAFGHGTMTAGIVHLVAPQAKIMPLKSFNANGAGYDSDILRAI